MESVNSSPKLPAIRTAMHMSRSNFTFHSRDSESQTNSTRRFQRRITRKPTLYPLDSLHAFQPHNFSISGSLVAALFTTSAKKIGSLPSWKQDVEELQVVSSKGQSINSVESFSEALKKKRLIIVNRARSTVLQSNRSNEKDENVRGKRKETRKQTKFIPIVHLSKIDSCDLDSSSSESEVSKVLKFLHIPHGPKAQLRPPHTELGNIETSRRQLIYEYELATANVLGNTKTIAKRRSKAMAIPERLFKHISV